MKEIIEEVLNQEYRNYLDEINLNMSLGWIDDEEIVNTVNDMCDDFEGIVSEKIRDEALDYIYKKDPSTLRYYVAAIGAILQSRNTLSHYDNVPSLYCVDKVTEEKYVGLTIPECIQTINDYAFCYCDNLISVTVKNKETDISPKAFYGCRNIEFNKGLLPKCVTDDKLLAVSLKYFALKERRLKEEIEVIDHSFIDYDRSSKKVFDTPIYKDYIENELSKFYTGFVFDHRFNRLFSSFKGNNSLCKLGFLSHKDMKKYDQYIDTSIERNEIVEKTKDIVKRIDEKDNEKYSKLKEVLNNVMDALSDDSNDVDYKTLHQKLFEQYSSLLDLSLNKDKSIDTDLLNDVKEVIDDISCIPVSIVDCLGVYDHGLDEIFLCLDNIFNDKTIEEMNKNGSIYDQYLNMYQRLFIELSKSVLVHEYTHYLHRHAVGEKTFKGASNFEIRVVNETIAETIQLCHTKTPNSGIYNIGKWIKKHSGCGVFPGWPYAGETVLANRAEIVLTNRAETVLANRAEKEKYPIAEEKELVNLLIEVSCKSYKTAYDLLMIFAGK